MSPTFSRLRLAIFLAADLERGDEPQAPPGAEAVAHMESRNRRWQARQQIAQRVERVESELRREVGESSRSARQELQHSIATFQSTLERVMEETRRLLENSRRYAYYVLEELERRGPPSSPVCYADRM